MATADDSIRPAALGVGVVFQGGYEILGELGSGTSGVVHRARQLSSGQEVAIKVLRARRGSSAVDAVGSAERFRREMRLSTELCHPNIVPLIDSGETDDGVLYAVFQYVPGATLDRVLAAEGPLSLAETVHLMTQVLDALSCAHARGIVHRDLKPENIMLIKSGVRRNALVLDFGLGGFVHAARDAALPRVTATQEIVGTPCYAAPEQLRGEPPSTRSDLYSWGLIFLECLTGQLAVGGGSVQDVLAKQLGPDPVPIPSWLADRQVRRVLETVTAKSAEKRDVTIDGLLQALGALVPAPGVQSAAAEPLPEGERRQLTVVSCGLTLSSTGAEAADLEALDELLHAQHAVIAEIAARHGGQLAGVLADRALLAFGYPHAQENDARRAARAALQIAAELTRRAEQLVDAGGVRLEVRLGVHTGVLIARELRHGLQHGLYDLVGVTPQVAARIETLAAPGEVLVSAETQRLLRDELAATPAGEHAVPGFSAPVTVYRLAGAERSAPSDSLSDVQATPLIGRAAALDQLTRQWQQARGGRGAALLITGEPGIGKSRLARELRRRLPPDAWLEARCVPEGADSPLRPLAELVLSMDETVDGLLMRYGFALDAVRPLFAALCALPPDERFPAPPLSPERQKELILGALVTLFTRVAAERPTVLAIEDLHWADPTTLECIGQLVQELRSAALADDRGARLLLVLTARPEFVAPWPAEDVSLMQLARLEPSDVEAMVLAGLGRDEALPSAVLAEIVRRADGIPLFVEEVTRVLGESGLPPNGDGRAGEQMRLEIPGTLRDLLMARLDRLSFGARDTAQLAAVLGREFRYELLRAVARKHEQNLRDDLRELTAAGLAYHRRSARSEAYVFKHALVRDVAYETLLRANRQSLHSRVGNTLRQRFPDVEQQQPELIALHYECGDEAELAIEYWKRAGDRAMARGAYPESMHHFQRALALVQRLPESPAQLQTELAVLESLGTALLTTRGYTAPEVEEIFARAAALCERLGGDVPIRVLHGIWGVHIMRSDADGTARMIPTMERLCRTSTDPVSLITAHGAIGVRAFFTGDFAHAAAAMERATTWYRTKGYERFLAEYGYDGGIYVFGYLMWSAWILGEAQRALAVRDEMMALAEQNQNPYGLTIALAYSMILERELGHPAEVRALADRAIPIVTEQKIYLWLGTTMSMGGWATAELGDVPAGIAEIQAGLAMLEAIGIRTIYAYYLSCLAEAEAAHGRLVESVAIANQCLGLSETLLDRFYATELHRLIGELWARRGDRGRAELSLRTAVELAREQQARIFQLRAATSLARVLREGGEAAAGRSLVAEACEWFGDKLATRDVLAARMLLAELY